MKPQIIFLIILIILLFFTPFGQRVRRSIIFYFIIMFPYRKWHFPAWLSKPIIKEEHRFKCQNREIISDIYRLDDGKEHPGMLVYAPLAEEGRNNPLVINFLGGLARMGYTVTAPFWLQRSLGNIYLTDIVDFKIALKWFKTQKYVLAKPIGIVAVSYGVGPAMVAIKKYSLEKEIRFLTLVSGFADLLETIKALITKKFQYKNIQDRMDPEPYAYTVMLKTAAVWCKNKKDQNIFSQINVRITENNFSQKISQISDSLSDEGRKIIQWYKSRNTQEFSTRYKKLSQKIQEYFKDLSPQRNQAFPQVPTLILHSKKDHLIPYTESIKLYDSLKKKTKSTLVLISAFDHTMPVPATIKNIFTIYLANFYRISKFLYKMLSFD